jgi:hypothetical protein
MLANEFPEHSIKGPQAISGTWVSIHSTSTRRTK